MADGSQDPVDGNGVGTVELSAEADAEYELESEEGAIWTGTRLLLGIATMAWAAVVFSFFYLRALDVGPAWFPAHTYPSKLLGSLIGGCVIFAALVLTYAAAKLRVGLSFEWTIGGFLAAAIGAVGVGLQAWEMSRLHFFPGEGGYTSLFVGFGPLNAVFILGGAYWAETLAARTLRLHKEIGPESYMAHSTVPEVRVFRHSLNGCVLYWWFAVAVEVLMYILFYIVH